MDNSFNIFHRNHKGASVRCWDLFQHRLGLCLIVPRTKRLYKSYWDQKPAASCAQGPKRSSTLSEAQRSPPCTAARDIKTQRT